MMYLYHMKLYTIREVGYVFFLSFSFSWQKEISN